jgi:hypothetical protein
MKWRRDQTASLYMSRIDERSSGWKAEVLVHSADESFASTIFWVGLGRSRQIIIADLVSGKWRAKHMI